MNHIKKIILLTVLFASGISLYCQTISPMLVGNNVWYTNPSNEVWELTKESGVTSLRIGGHAFDDNIPTTAQLLSWVKRIQSMGAEPIMQVSQYKTPAEAANLVRYFNIESHGNAPIKYWNIGNEPWLQNGRPAISSVGAMVEAYFKPIAAAMKEVDPTIKIYGPDFCYYIDGAINDLFGGANNIAGKVPEKDYYYCDGISWHLYPQDGNINLAYAGLESFRNSIVKCKTKVDAVNIQLNRTGDEALGWGIGEYNAKGGPEVHTWMNGHMFGGILNLCMKYGATYATTWSMFENSGSRQGTDFSFIDGANMTPRPTYRHMQMIAQNFKGNYEEGTSSLIDIIVFGAKNEDTISVMIMNRAVNPASYTLHLNKTGTSDNQVNLNIDADTSIVYNDIISGLATHTLIFKNDGIVKIDYTNMHFENELPPSYTNIYNTSEIPDEPLGFEISSITYKSIGLIWEVNSSDTLTGFLIERKKDTDEAFKLIAITGNELTGFEDSGLQPTTVYNYRIQAYNTSGKSAYTDVLSATTIDLPPAKAFNGPHSIPGKIQAEDFDDNEEGIGYHDSEPTNQGGSYRLDEGVDIEVCTDIDGGYNVGYIENGEWLNYSIENIAAGNYDINLRTASNSTVVRKLKVYLDDVYLGSVSPSNTGGWQKWETLKIQNISIETGINKILKLIIEGSGFNINWIDIAETTIGISRFGNADIQGYYYKPDNLLHVKLENPEKKVIIALFDISGRKVFQKSEINFVSGEYSVDIPQGMYLLNVQSGQNVLSRKITVN